MSSATETPLPVPPAATWDSMATTLSTRVADYVSIARPGIALMVLVTVTVGFMVGQQGEPLNFVLAPAWLGILMVAAGSSALNQWFERRTDARMERTRTRPLPSGRLPAWEVFAVGTGIAVAGTALLYVCVNPLTAVLTASTFVLYAFVYTPLKRVTSLCTALGAIPGAMPPVLGWTSAGHSLDLTAFALFGILFFWQFPHFLAIAWLHREDYLAAGLKMLPGGRPYPHVTGLMALVYALGLVPISLIPVWLGQASVWYGLVAVVMGAVYAVAAFRFAWDENRGTARRVLWLSLLYLPAVLGALAGDHLRLLS